MDFQSIEFYFSSCAKEGVEEAVKEVEMGITLADDTFIFGHYFGECGGERCIEIFKIEDGKVYEDTADLYPDGTANNFTWSLLSDEKFQLVKNFPSFFPDELLDDSFAVIGQPDAGDWGGYIIGKIDNEELRIWLIDTIDSNIPEYLHTFNDMIAFTTSLL